MLRSSGAGARRSRHTYTLTSPDSVMPFLHETTHCAESVAFLDVGERRHRAVHDVRRKVAQPRVNFTAVERIVRATNDRHQLTGRRLLGHRLPPFLGEVFGGGTSRVDVEVRRVANDQTAYPFDDRCVAKLN